MEVLALEVEVDAESGRKLPGAVQGRLDGNVVDLGGEDAGEVQQGIVPLLARSAGDVAEAAAVELERVGRHLLQVPPGRDDLGKRAEVGDMGGGGGGGVREGGGDSATAASPAAAAGGGGERLRHVRGGETLHWCLFFFRARRAV